MNEEYKVYRFLALIYITLIANTAVLVTERDTYFWWFCSSILVLLLLAICERKKVLDLVRSFSNYKISRGWIYLLPFVFTYSRHYGITHGVNYAVVALLQSTNVILFFTVFCVEKKGKSEKGLVSV